MAYRYRDRSTGHFASKAKWEKSHGPSGKYVREIVEPPEEEPEDEGDEEGPDFPEFIDVESLDDWMRYYEDDIYGDFEPPDEYAGGVDTGRAGRK